MSTSPSSSTYQSFESLSSKGGISNDEFTGSAVSLFGRRWFCSADDEFIPSLLRPIVHIPLFIGISIIYSMNYSNEIEENCVQDQILHIYIICCIVLYLILCLLDIATMISSYYHSIRKTNDNLIILLYLRYITLFIHLIITIIGTAFSFRHVCKTISNIQFVSQILVIINWIVLSYASCSLLFSYNSDGNHTDVPINRVESCFSLITCAWLWKHDSSALDENPDIFREIAYHFRAMFKDLRNIVPSDMVFGMMMVEELQSHQKRLGKKFMFDNTNNHESTTIALSGHQPELPAEDWNRLSEAKYYSNYAIGSYGWMLYLLTDPCSYFGLCLSCCLPFNDYIEGDNCCHCSVNAFIIRSKLPTVTHIISANLNTDFGKVTYYVAADHAKRTLVISIRGTMSLQDCVSDIYCVYEKMDKFGLKGHYTHSGILHAASNLHRDLVKSDILTNFFQNHPSYKVVVCGHSLGAGTACLLSARLRIDYPTIKCYCFAPPPLFDEFLLKESAEYITSIVYADDMISRLSTSSCQKLKNQMKFCFKYGAESRWEYFSSRLLSKPTEIDGYREQSFTDSLLCRNANSHALFSEFKSEDLLNAGSNYSIYTPSSLLSINAEVSTILDLDDVKINIEDDEMKYGELYLPGAIFQLLPTDDPKTFCPNSNKRLYDITPDHINVFRSSHLAYLELIVSKQMFINHMPYHYTEALQSLKIPTINNNL